MGTKRIGLARMEALMEALKREITGFNVEGTAASITTINASSVTLARNSVNVVTRAAATTLALPAAADCSRGDVIVVRYNVAITAAAKHNYGTAGEFFAASSNIYKPATTPGVFALVTAANGTSNDFLGLTGVANAGPGIGSELKFHFDGSQWVVNGKCEPTGDGTGTSSVAFANT